MKSVHRIILFICGGILLVHSVVFADLSDDLMCHWKFEGNLNSSGTHAYHGSPIGDPIIIPGIYGLCISLDGDDCIDFFNFDFSAWDNTIALWIRPQTFSDQCFIGKQSSAGERGCENDK